MRAVEKAGTPIEIYPLLHEKNTDVKIEGASLCEKIIERFKKSSSPLQMHPEAVPYVECANFFPFLSIPIILIQFYYLIRKPLAYLSTFFTLIQANLGSANHLLSALAIFPKSVYIGYHMRQNNITHIHAHFANHPAAAAFIIHRISGISYSFTAHGADFQVDQHMLCKKIAESAFTITISEYNKQFLTNICGQHLQDEIKVLHCGVDTRVFQPPPPEMLTASGDIFTIISIGTFYEVKGHTYLIEACRLLKKQGLAFKCYLVGSGPFQNQLSQQVTIAGLQDHVIFYGQRTRQEIVEILRDADVLALPSIPASSGRHEGIPVVLMEAMASGNPVVASNISGIPELIDDNKNGLLVPPKDPESLAKALNRLYDDDSLRTRLGQAGRQTILQNFDLHKNANTLIQMFEEANRL